MKKRVLSLFLAITLCLTLTPTGALAAEGQPPEQTVSVTQEAETGADENASPAKPEENPTENAPAAAEKNTADEEPGKEPAAATGKDEPKADGSPSDDDAAKVQNQLVMAAAAGPGEPTMMGQNNLLALADEGQTPANAQNSEGGGIYVPPGGPTEGGGGTYIPGEDTRTEIWCVGKPDSIGRTYDGTADGGTISFYTLGFTDRENSYTLTEGTDFTATKTFDSADAGDRTVTVALELIGDAATKYKLKAGTETFTIGGTIDKATPELTVSLSKTTCTVGEKILPLLSVSGVQENAVVTYYYAPVDSGYLEFEGTEVVPAIDGNTAISSFDEEGNNTYYVYAKTAETTNYKEDRSATVALTVTEPAAASVTTSSGVTNNYTSLDDALNAANDGDTVTLLSDVDLGETYVTIDKSITFDLGGKTLSSSEAWLLYGVLLIKNATVTVKNGTVKAAGDGSCAIQAYRSGAIMTLEDVTATVTSDKSSVTVGDFGSAVIKSGDYQGLYVGAKSQVTLEGGTFRPYMDTITNENVKSIFWKVNETTDATSRDCMELLGDGCVYVDENKTQVRTGGGFNAVVTVQQGTAIDAPVAKIGDVKYASLSKAINAVQNGGTITLLDDLDLGNGAVLQVGSSKKDFTIDLDSHTLSADGACLIMLHNGSQLTLKNGTLDGSSCTSYNGVLYISSNSGPKLTLENVTAKSGSVADLLNGQRSVPLVYVTNGTVVFDGGTYTGGVLLETDGNAVLKSGTFQKGTNDYSIKTEDSGKHLSDYLDDDSQFWNDNTPLVLSNKTQTADEVTVRPCKHNWENGKCTVCQKVCDHGSADGKSMTAAVCPTCGMKAAAQVDITGSDAKYFLTFSNALVYATQNNGCTLKLLANVTDPVSINTPFIFDLNGHNFNMLSVGARAKIRDSSTTKGTIKELKVINMTDADDNETVLTVADLLEEGYAFKSSSENKWYFGVEKAITNVTVQPAPIKSVTAEHPTVTVEYGKTSGVTLTATAVPATEGGTVSYQWYKIGGTDSPIQDATDNTYPLPADLGADTHTYRLTATSDGYPKSVDITVKVTPISLKGATVTVKDLTYNGQKQFPTVTVKLGETTLTKNTDFDVNATMQTNAGSYKLTISGNGNYSGEIKDVEWKIEPMKIDSVMVSSDISKTYDGTAAVTKTAEEWATALTFKTLSASGVVDVPSSAYTISDAYFVEKSGEETIHSPDAGEKYGITFKIALKSSNYILQNYYDEEPAATKEITQSGGANFTIRQANVTSPGEITQLVFNDLAKTYTLNLAALLPELSEGCEYGDIQYQGCDYHFTDSTYLDSNNGMSVSKEGILTLPTVSAHTSDVNTQIGTITIPVVTTNYQKFEFTIKVVISARIPLNASGVTVSASEITYGQTLNESKLTATGTMKHPGTGEEVKGTFAWTNPEAKPGAAGDYTASWTFTPAEGYEEYAPATGNVTVKVNKADPTFTAPAAKTLTYTGSEQTLLTAGSTQDGTMMYRLGESGEFVDSIPNGKDAGTYTVCYKVVGDGNHNDTEVQFVSVTIKPMELLRFVSTPSVTKTYDGTAVAPLSEDAVTFNSRNASKLSLPKGAYSITNARFTMKQTDGNYADSPEVGNGKSLSFTVTLTSDNYVFESTTEDSKTIVCDIATDAEDKFTITKATAPTGIQTGTLNVINGTTLEYTYDAKQILPAAPNGTYGTVLYSGEPSSDFESGYTVNSFRVGINSGVLTLTIDAQNGGKTGKIGSVTIYVTTDNYESFNLPLDLYAVNKITPVADGKITAADITYGDALSKSTISGKMKDPNTGATVNGTFTWTDGTVKPDANDSYEAQWTFTPAAGYEKYATATGTVTIKVNKATPTFTAPTAQENLTYTGQEQALITAGSVTDYSTMQYSLTENGTYSQDIPTGTDAGAYTVWYRVIGDANHNDTAPASVAVSIGKKPLTITGVTAESKPYDGTTNADISSVTFDNVTLNRGTDYTVTASFDDAGVGSGKNVTATVTLMGQAAKNYFLEQSDFLAIGSGSITKAAAPDFTMETALVIINGYEKTYTVTLPTLPTLETPKEYGALTYEISEIKLDGGYYTGGAKVENGKLTLPIQKNDVETTGSVGTVTVVIKSINYEDITLTVKVSAVNQITPVPEDGTITATPITYGNELSASTITGTMQDPTTREEVNGTFTWVTPAEKLNAGSHDAKWTFTPDKSYGGKYTTYTDTAPVTVNPKAVTVSGITAKDKVYDGNTDAVLDYSKVTLNGVLENDTLTVTATGTFEKADTGEQKVTISGLELSGASAANYVPSTENNQTETTATITAREVTVTITPNGGTYGSVTAAAAVLSGVVDGETVPVTLTYTGNGYNSTSVPTDVDSYTVTASIADSNYILTGETTANFVITPKTVIVSGITAKDKAYDGTTNATLDFSNAKFDGILENDKLTVTAKGVFEKTEAGKWNVAISDLTLGGNSVANYVLAESGNQTETTATITAKQITVSITPNGGTYGETITPATVKANDVVGEDTPTITLTYTGTANDGTAYADTTPPAKAGTYTVTATTTNPNYTLDPDTNTAEFAIAKRPATVTPDNQSKVYEEKDPELTYKVRGVLDSETLEGITLTRAEGENAGKYAITATADADANPNYEVTFAEGKFTINPKSIDGATVKLGKALTANGAEQTQTVEKVLLDGKELPADSYTVAGNTATAPGSHTLTITAKGNYTDSVEQTYAIAPAKAEDAPGEEIAIGSGEVKVVVKSEGAVPPATLLTNKAELLAMLVDNGDITADELAQIADGASVDIALTVKEANVPDEVKTAMAQAAKGCTIGQYLDISLFKYMTVNGKQQDGVALRTTKNALTISVAVPDALINTNSAVNRTYCIVRNHEGTIDVLDAAFDAANKTLTFKTDRFSDYAIAYKDTAVPSSGSNPGSNNSSNDSEAKKNEVAAPTPAPTPASTSKPSTITAMPQTGDTSNPTLYVVLLVASLLGLAVVFVCKKRNDK